ncbi:MAG: hypothetical protein K2Q25_02280 [Mycobacteriaceae bacterium]|nr:hypothetical protein [Mycobacteriaceae bacterium]
MSPEEEARLLAAVREASAEAAQSRAKADEDSARRRAALQNAMDAGISRDSIAEAAGVQRIRLYQILKG